LFEYRCVLEVGWKERIDRGRQRPTTSAYWRWVS
jgi:hypothetical protein